MTEPSAAVGTIDVSVLIVNWNAGDLLRRCVASLPEAFAGLAGEAIVVDNGSTDDSLAGLPRVAWLSVLRRADNPGFAVANNVAARQARGRLLLLLNPDTECRPGAIRTLVELAEARPDSAAVGPMLVNPDGSLQRSAWIGFPGLLPALIDALYLWKLAALPAVRRMEPRPAADLAPIDVDHLLGACMLIPRAAWQAVGELDPGYFLFLEETDWCRRARRAGWRIVYAPEAQVMHHGQQSVHRVPSRSAPSYYRGYLRFARRAGAGGARLLALRAVLLLAVVVRLGLWSLRLLGPRHALARRMLAGYLRAFGTIVTA